MGRRRWRRQSSMPLGRLDCRITERNPHSLYISRYQLGRDATVYWPSLDLKFVNDTETWILVKGLPEADGIRISIYGGERRRVESSAGTMSTTGSPPVERVKDPTLAKGQYRCRGSWLVSEPDLGHADDLCGGWRRDPHGNLEHVLQGRDARRPCRYQGQGAEEQGRGRSGREDEAPRGRLVYAAASDSALAIASASHSGTRVGLYVSRSTVAWLVCPSATSSPSRTIRYSYLNRAPRRSVQRAQIVRRSSK